jgi:hypothetical protein
MGIKGVKTSDECNMTKLTKKYDSYSDHIRKAHRKEKKGLEQCLLKDKNPSKQHVSLRVKQLLQ